MDKEIIVMHRGVCILQIVWTASPERYICLNE